MGKGKRRKGGKGKFTAKKKAEKKEETSLLDTAANNLKKSNVNDASGVLLQVYWIHVLILEIFKYPRFQ